MERSFIHTEGGEKYNVPKSTIIDKHAVSMQQRLSQNQHGYFVVLAKTNVMLLLPGKSSVFVLAGITLVLEEIRLLNEYRSFFPVLQGEGFKFLPS